MVRAGLTFSPVPEYYTESLKDLKPGDVWSFILTFLGRVKEEPTP